MLKSRPHTPSVDTESQSFQGRLCGFSTIMASLGIIWRNGRDGQEGLDNAHCLSHGKAYS